MATSLEKLQDHELIFVTQDLVAQERKLTTQVLYHLREIEVRLLHLKRGYSSLHEFAVKELGYSDGAAYRRISAMRLLKELPELKESIESGRLSLTTVSVAQTFFRNDQKDYSVHEKRELVQKLEGKSRREAEQLFASISPQAIPQERERVLSDTQTEIRFTASQELMTKFERLRELFSHKNPHASYAELFEMMADQVLKKLDPRNEPAKRASPEKLTDPRRRTATRLMRRQLARQDRERCTYIDQLTGRRCSSRFLLQVHHKKAYALGGETRIENLTLLCAAHNRLLAIPIKPKALPTDSVSWRGTR
jgi:hypothetical protein